MRPALISAVAALRQAARNTAAPENTAATAWARVAFSVRPCWVRWVVLSPHSGYG
ncbi:MAG: hypothetical protein QOG10_7157 [Kribbellaceae bacterium]|jgi:hypothetical protein|nr:hypothetical protein [Kribbellaceae bacterium]